MVIFIKDKFPYNFNFGHFFSSLIVSSPLKQKSSIFKNFCLSEVSDFPLSGGDDKKLRDIFA